MTEEIIIERGCVHCSLCVGDEECYLNRCKRLEQENKELKKQIESDKGLITVGGKQQYQYLQRVEELEQENKELKTKLDVFAFTISQYESALEEVKNVLKEICKEECDYTKTKFCGDCDCRYGQILNKIEEVLNESK